MTSVSQSNASKATSELVRGVDFVGVPTHDVPTAAAFYGETLGLPRSVYMPERHFTPRRSPFDASPFLPIMRPRVGFEL